MIGVESKAADSADASTEGEFSVFTDAIIEYLKVQPLSHEQIAIRVKKDFPDVCDDSDISKWGEPRWSHNLRARLEYLKKKGIIKQNKPGDNYVLQ